LVIRAVYEEGHNGLPLAFVEDSVLQLIYENVSNLLRCIRNYRGENDPVFRRDKAEPAVDAVVLYLGPVFDGYYVSPAPEFLIESLPVPVA
jgi:hypothetical protein